MKNTYDFRKGDAVYDLMFGNGFVFWGNSKNRIVVAFTDDKKEALDHAEFDEEEYSSCVGEYNCTGKIAGYITPDVDSILFPIDIHRTLFHGHDLPVKVSEKEPIRYGWVSIYLSETGKPFFGSIYNSEKEAKEKRGINYITTIELKPKNE
jgi:hypothetical protein